MRPCTPPCVRTGGMQRKACTNLGLPSMGGYHWARQALPQQQQQQQQPPCPALHHGTIRSGTPADSPSNTCRCQHGTEVHVTGMLHRPATHTHTHMHATARRCVHMIAGKNNRMGRGAHAAHLTSHLGQWCSTSTGLCCALWSAKSLLLVVE
jgi:hypothetical protein